MGRRKKRIEKEPPAAPTVSGEARTSLRGLLKDVVVSEPQRDAPKPKEPVRAERLSQDSSALSERRAERFPGRLDTGDGERRPDGKAAEPAREGARQPISQTLRGDDRIAWHDAFSGVRPLGAKDRARARVAPTPPPSAPSPGDEEARARLAALVGGGVRFEILRDGDEVRGRRAGSSESALRALMRNDARPGATLDLHGMRASEAEREVVRFLRAEQRRGMRRVLIVHGKGLHSDGGPVLSEVVVRAISEGGAAPVVQAFVTASHALGGSGALMIELTP